MLPSRPSEENRLSILRVRPGVHHSLQAGTFLFLDPVDLHPMKRQWLYILASVAEAPSYGRAIRDDALALSGNRLPLWPAELYRSLSDLVDRGWLKEIPRPDGSKRRERFYTLTPPGRAALLDELAHLERLATQTRVWLSKPPTGLAP